MDCSPPGFSVRGILQARILERVAFAFSRGIFPTRGRTQVSCTGRRIFFFFFYHLTTREALTGSQMATFAAASFFPPLGHHEARGLLSTSASIEPVTPALESGILTIGPPGKPYEGPLLAMSTRGSSWGLFYGDINPQPRDLINHRRAHLQIPTHRW